ncbi:hypothetical protein M569_16093, partial [Genlisea aurea]
LNAVRASDAEALLALKAVMDPRNSLQWRRQTDVCNWFGVKQCLNGSVTKLVVERHNLSGTIDGKSINELYELRVLSLKENAISGQIPQLYGLINLKALYLNKNRFSGVIPPSISQLHRLKVLVLSDNKLSGHIPRFLVDLPKLYQVDLQGNRFTGVVPPFRQNSLRFLNVSYNELSGKIPETTPLLRLNGSSFRGNFDLCGEQIRKPCDSSHSPQHSKHNKKLVVLIISSTIAGFTLLSAAGFATIICFLKQNRETRSKPVSESGQQEEETPPGPSQITQVNPQQSGGSSAEAKVGKLIFLGSWEQHMSYSLDDLLKASAETLGRGTMGSTYKAVLETGYIVTVKRLKDGGKYPKTEEEFMRHVEILGSLRHPNLVPLRAYFRAKQEHMLVYDYFPNGSLFTLLHGTRGSGGSKPLHWTSCLKIAEDLASALFHIHQVPHLTHGNLKSTNVLLGPDFESCLTDYGLAALCDPNGGGGPRLTREADVYSYGMLLLELLTGRTPPPPPSSSDGGGGGGVGRDVAKWVKCIREEDADSSSDERNEEKLSFLIGIASSCVSEDRPPVGEVLKMIREARGEAQVVSSNSSDHSPGRWSESVHSLSKEDHSTI